MLFRIQRCETDSMVSASWWIAEIKTLRLSLRLSSEGKSIAFPMADYRSGRDRLESRTEPARIRRSGLAHPNFGLGVAGEQAIRSLPARPDPPHSPRSERRSGRTYPDPLRRGEAGSRARRSRLPGGRGLHERIGRRVAWMIPRDGFWQRHCLQGSHRAMPQNAPFPPAPTARSYSSLGHRPRTEPIGKPARAESPIQPAMPQRIGRAFSPWVLGFERKPRASP